MRAWIYTEELLNVRNNFCGIVVNYIWYSEIKFPFDIGSISKYEWLIELRKLEEQRGSSTKSKCFEKVD